MQGRMGEGYGITQGPFLIGLPSDGMGHRDDHSVREPLESSMGSLVSTEALATNAWNQNQNSSNPGRQNNNNKNNSNRVRAVRRTKLRVDLPTVEELFEAYFDCRKRKRNTANALVFEQNLERNLMNLYHDLIQGNYTPGKSICFVVDHPKIREVWAADFRDRVVHHLLYNRISSYFHNRFIHDSYACIPGKGTHRAVERAEKFSRQITQNNTREAYVLKMDVANFFMSIDKQVMDSLVSPHLDGWWKDLFRTVLFHDPTTNYRFNGNPDKLKLLPKRKSLFHTEGRGLPIGNLSSQFLANVYMNELDQYAKHKLKLKYYIRYVDDILVFGECPKELAKLPIMFHAFLQDRLKMSLHPNKTSINKISHGFDALGFVVKPRCRYVRRFTVDHAYSKLEGMLRGGSPYDEVIAVANSYFGIFREANTYKLRIKFSNLLASYGYVAIEGLTKIKTSARVRKNGSGYLQSRGGNETRQIYLC